MSFSTKKSKPPFQQDSDLNVPTDDPTQSPSSSLPSVTDNNPHKTAFVHHILKKNLRKMEKLTISQSSPVVPVPIYKNQIQDALMTDTILDQEETEDSVLALLLNASSAPPTRFLLKDKHIQYLEGMLGPLPGAFVTLDASRPWCLYWALNGMMLLGDDTVPQVYGERAVSTILACVSPEGGIGGSHGHLGHLAATYAGVNALAISGNEEGWLKLDRKAMYKWLLSLKRADGSFQMHIGGERDTRSVYCALAIASLLNILTPELVENTAAYLASCQTFEGGFSATPGLEAHGGYAFCALAAFCIMFPPSEVSKHINISKFMKWLSVRQHQPEGGFSGRTNKLVDGCYNHWVGGCWALLENIVSYHDLWDRAALQNYTLYCCQNESGGGLRDKPGKGPDAYHTNYTLAGLSGAQYRYTYSGSAQDRLGDYAFNWTALPSERIVVLSENWVAKINPIHVVTEGVAEKMHRFYKDVDELEGGDSKS